MASFPFSSFSQQLPFWPQYPTRTTTVLNGQWAFGYEDNVADVINFEVCLCLLSLSSLPLFLPFPLSRALTSILAMRIVEGKSDVGKDRKTKRKEAEIECAFQDHITDKSGSKLHDLSLYPNRDRSRCTLTLR
jgi:hypothetical protein